MLEGVDEVVLEDVGVLDATGWLGVDATGALGAGVLGVVVFGLGFDGVVLPKGSWYC